MINTASLYQDRGTVLHGLDPRTKIVGFVLLSGLLLVFNDPRYLAVLVAVLVLLGALGQSLGNYFRVRYLAFFLFLTSWVAWQFYIHGQVIARLGPVGLSRQGVLYGLSSGLRVSSALLLGTLFLSVTGIEELLAGLIRLGLPYRVGFVISVTARLVPLLALTLGDIVRAQTARGLDLQTRNPVKRIARLFPVLVPFLTFSARHAARLAMALESKGFRPSGARSGATAMASSRRLGPILTYLAIGIPAAGASAVILAWGLELLGIAPFKIISDTLVGNFIVGNWVGAILFFLVYDRLRSMSLTWDSIMGEANVGRPLAFPIGAILVLAGSYLGWPLGAFILSAGSITAVVAIPFAAIIVGCLLL